MTNASSLSLSNFIGLSDQIYNDLPQQGTRIEINHSYCDVILPPVDDATTSYQRMVLLDEATNSLIVVNRGTQELEDWGIDAVMPNRDVNLQRSDALS